MIDTVTTFIRALRDQAGDGFLLTEIRSRVWKAPTFAGTRFEATFSIEGDDAHGRADRLIVALVEGNLALKGQIVADFDIVSDIRQPGRVALGIEALTVEDA